MADDLTLALGARSFNALKLVPYGKLEEVLPWLLRRLEESQDALGASADERPLLRREVHRRALQAAAARPLSTTRPSPLDAAAVGSQSRVTAAPQRHRLTCTLMAV